MKVDILAIGAHPDDVELSCAGTLLKHKKLGYSFGILDLTQGELGTRGSAPLRMQEAEAAGKILGAAFRMNIGIPDGFFTLSRENKLKIIRIIRMCQPTIVLANAVKDRHIDHGRGAQLVHEACFLSGLQKINTRDDEGNDQERWRPNAIYHYTQDQYLDPDLVVDITGYMDQKMESILAFRSQFYDPGSDELDSPISGKDFIDFIKGRARTYGRQIGVEFGEGFTVNGTIGVEDLLKIT